VFTNLAKGRGALLVSKHLNILSRQSTIKISLQTPKTLGTDYQQHPTMLGKVKLQNPAM
jgi:hypothetical protein